MSGVRLTEQAAYTLRVCNERNGKNIFLIDGTTGVVELASLGLLKTVVWDTWRVVAQVTDVGREWLTANKEKQDAHRTQE